jgi:CO/xanthine dehydrogenase Mo-binding subunit
MESRAVVADWRPDGLTVWISTQFTAGVRHELAQAFGLKLNQVRDNPARAISFRDADGGLRTNHRST